MDLPETETQAAFARRIEVDRSAINYYRKTGKLSEDAFVKDGKRLLVRPAVAMWELKRSLDMVQSAANGRARIPEQEAPIPDPPPLASDDGIPAEAGAEPPRAPAGKDATKAQYEIERLREIRLRNEAAERKRRADAGIYTRTDDVRRAIAGTFGQLWRQIDGDMATWAEEIAAATGADPREIEVQLRGLLRTTRERLAATATDLRDQFSEVVEDPDDDDAEEAYPAAAE